MTSFVADCVGSTSEVVVEYPTRISCYSLSSDGSYTESPVARGMAFIPESLFYKIFDPEVAEHIRKYYGGIVGVMHEVHDSVCPPAARTRMYVLG